MQYQRKQIVLIGFLASLIAFIGCSKDAPIEPTVKDQNNQVKQVATSSGTEVFRSVQTLNQIGQTFTGPGWLRTIDVPPVGYIAQSGVSWRQAMRPLFQQAQSSLKKWSEPRNVMGDTLLWEAHWVDSTTGVMHHGWIIYNTDIGEANVFFVSTNYPAGFPLERDSMHVIVNLNFTIADTTDDVVELLENAKNYRSGYKLLYEEGRIVPDAYQPGNQPAGGVIEGLSVYAPELDTAAVRFRLEYHEGASGSKIWSKAVDFRDNTRYSEDIFFNENNVVFNLIHRDGTRELGQFNLLDQDHLSFKKVITLPVGSNPQSVVESGTSSRNLVDSTDTTHIRREVFYANGMFDWHEISVIETRQNGFRHLEVNEAGSDGTSGSWTLQEGPSNSEVHGFWIDKEKHYILFSGTIYQNGSGDMHVEVYRSKAAHDNGEPPIFTADFHFGPNGSGPS